jgi:hypothetical protein
VTAPAATDEPDNLYWVPDKLGRPVQTTDTSKVDMRPIAKTVIYGNIIVLTWLRAISGGIETVISGGLCDGREYYSDDLVSAKKTHLRIVSCVLDGIDPDC